MPTPNSYKDPFWLDKINQAEQKVGLPTGLLKSIVYNGEKSNNDQVSSAGAKSPFQIIPSTRNLLIKKYGIDPYLNEDNAAQSAALLLRESLDRNGGKVSSAVAEYHGGTDRKNWGKITNAYVKRVMNGLNSEEQPIEASAVSDIPPSQEDAGVSDASIASVYEAYKNGQMSPEDTAEFEQDIKDGRIVIPGSLDIQPQGETPQADSNILPNEVLEAYSSGKMSEQDMVDLETDVKDGLVSVPEGFTLKETKLPGVIDNISEAITGNKRSTPEIEALPAQEFMPLPGGTDLKSIGVSTASAFSSPEETVQILKANYPDIGVRQDEKGNFILKSPVNGQEYAIKPGFRLTDLPALVAQIGVGLAGGVAGSIPKAIVTNAGIQGAIEGGQAVAGGNFDAGNVALAGAVGGGAEIGGRLLSSGIGKGATDIAEDAIITPKTDLIEEARISAKEGVPSQSLVSSVEPSQEVVGAADRLGLLESTDLDILSSSQPFKEISQALKSSNAGLKAIEREDLKRAIDKSDEIMQSLGGTKDISSLGSSIKSDITDSIQALEKEAENLYSELKDKIPATTKVEASSMVDFLRERSDELLGVANLSPPERIILKKIVGKDGKSKVLSYALLDDIRKNLTSARISKQGIFKDADSGILKKLESVLLEDQKRAVENAGHLDLFNTARSTVALRKGIEDDVVELFGKDLSQSIMPSLGKGVTSLARGDAEPIVNILKKVPEKYRQDVTATALWSSLKGGVGKETLTPESFVKSYAMLKNNKKSFDAIMGNLPAEARTKLQDLNTYYSAVVDTAKNKPSSARISAINKQITQADSLVKRTLESAKRIIPATAVASLVSPLGGLSTALGVGIANVLTKPVPGSILRQLDDVISSPEFRALALADNVSGKKVMIERMNKNKSFQRLMRSLSSKEEKTDGAKFLTGVINSTSQATKDDF